MISIATWSLGASHSFCSSSTSSLLPAMDAARSSSIGRRGGSRGEQRPAASHAAGELRPYRGQAPRRGSVRAPRWPHELCPLPRHEEVTGVGEGTAAGQWTAGYGGVGCRRGREASELRGRVDRGVRSAGRPITSIPDWNNINRA